MVFIAINRVCSLWEILCATCSRTSSSSSSPPRVLRAAHHHCHIITRRLCKSKGSILKMCSHARPLPSQWTSGHQSGRCIPQGALFSVLVNQQLKLGYSWCKFKDKCVECHRCHSAARNSPFTVKDIDKESSSSQLSKSSTLPCLTSRWLLTMCWGLVYDCDPCSMIQKVWPVRSTVYNGFSSASLFIIILTIFNLDCSG